MNQPRKTLLIGLIWATAASTLVAGLPRVICICHSQKPLTVRILALAQQPSCCCGGGCQGGCCQSREARANTLGSRACCGHNEDEPGSDVTQPTTQKNGHGLQVNARCCQQVVMNATGLAPVVTEIRQLEAESAAIGGFLNIVSAICPQPVHRKAFHDSIQQPPPTDLVVNLKRLLI